MLGRSSNETRMVQPLKPGHLGPDALVNVDDLDQYDEPTVCQWIKDNVPSLMSRYRPTWWLPNGHFQTAYMIFSAFTKRDEVEYTRTLLRLSDGGTLGLDFAPRLHASLPPDAPTIVFCHGLAGGSHESYVRTILSRIIRPVEEGGLGVRAVVINSRGCAGVPITSDQLYSVGSTLDLSIALHYLRATYPDSPLHGAGFSLGAGMLTRYLGETSTSSLLSSGIVLGVPANLPGLAVRLTSHWFYSKLYSRAMAMSVLGLFFREYAASPEVWDKSDRLTKGDLERLKTMWKRGKSTHKEVDEWLISKIGGPNVEGLWPFPSADEYYAFASPQNVLRGVKRPLLCISSMDDPIIDSSYTPIPEVEASSHLLMALTSQGGHLGWFTGLLARERWITRPVIEFLTAAVRDLPLTGSAVKVVKGSSSGAEDGRDSTIRSRGTCIVPGSDPKDEWTWVETLAHEIKGVQGRLGWKAVQTGEVIFGEKGIGTLRGL